MRGLHVHVGSQILDVEPFAESVRAARRAGRVPGLRPRRRPRRPLHLGRPPADASPTTSTPSSAPPASTCPPTPRSSSNRAGAWWPSAATTLYRVVTVKRGAHHLRRGRRRHGRQPRGRAVRAALRGRASPTGSTRRRHRDGDRRRPALRERRRARRRRRRCRDPRVGDLLAVPATGAYCFTMSNNYNGSRRIPVVFVRDGACPARRPAGDLGRTCWPATWTEQRAGHIHAQSFRWTPMPVHTPRDGRSADHRGRV